MVLCEHRLFGISYLKRGASREFDSLDHLLICIPDLDWLEREASAVSRACDYRTKLPVVGASVEGKGLQPLHPRRVSMLARKIIARVSGWRQHHLRLALRADVRAETLLAHTAVQQPTRN